METPKYKAMTRTQLAQRYQVCLKTFNKMLAKIPDFIIDKSTRILTPKEVLIIINHLGEPPD
ncbi:hypothetical protein [Arcicella rigui]|uniref:DUF4248 domain-containing protein n=1 Tax=Arcicella rigui TaxID=797020 RepID=A0ABU5QAU7_9BACT|nr:hypothetical protein [Arcicella rigui]MEA5139960.1 hypothetical protein [Arcicella rigui]